MNILEILKSKSRNDHYTNRYYKFILNCIEQNKLLPKGAYTEKHHICPKAKDMFPEYKSFRDNPWNRVDLTYRQHLLAHVMLWKAFGKSQTYALECMMSICTAETNERLSQRKVPTKYIVQYLEKVRMEHILNKKGYSCYKNSAGDILYLHKSDPRVVSGEWVGQKTGSVTSDEAKAKMSKAKLKNRTVKLYFLDNEITVKLMSPDYQEYLNQGWSIGLSDEDREYRNKLKYEKVSKSMLNRYTYCYPDGTEYGFISIDDPAIQEFGLIAKKTENQMAQFKTIQKMGSQVNTGTKVYNNGIIEIKRKKDPGGEWIEGMLPDRQAKKTKVWQEYTKSIVGYTTWNDGVENHRVPKDGKPESHWVRGMLRKDSVPDQDRLKIIELYEAGTLVAHIVKCFDGVYSSHKINGVLKPYIQSMVHPTLIFE